MVAARLRALCAVCAALLCATVIAGCDSGAGEGPPEVPPRGDLTRDEAWQVEVQYLADELVRRHENAFFYTSGTGFYAATDSLKAAVPGLADHEVAVGMLRLAARLGDAHTTVDPWSQLSFRRFPLRVQWFEDGLFVVAAAPDYVHLIGTKLTAIGGHSVTEVLDAVRPIISHENESWLREASTDYMAIGEVLQALGILEQVDAGRFTFEEEGEVSLTATSSSFSINWVGAFEEQEPPHYLRNEQDYYWYEYLPTSQTLYVHYRRCADQPGYPFGVFVDDLFVAADTLAVTRIVVDLRLNTGGNSAIIRPLLRELDERPRMTDAGLYALIGRRTFSSGLLNAVQLRDDLNATLVGVPTGGAPNGFGEVRTFRLPYSRYEVRYSTKFFSLTDGTERTLQPDRVVTVSSTDHFAGRDPVLQSIVR